MYICMYVVTVLGPITDNGPNSSAPALEILFIIFIIFNFLVDWLCWLVGTIR